MNQQRQKQRPVSTQRSPSSSITVLEGVLGTLHLLLGSGFGGLVLWFVFQITWGDTAWITRIALVLAPLFSLTTALSGLFLLCRQRHIAYYAQLLSALASAVLVGLVAYQIFLDGLHKTGGWQIILLYPAVALWMAWFAWFLKRQEESARD
jgi:hypothetical protein